MIGGWGVAWINVLFGRRALDPSRIDAKGPGGGPRVAAPPAPPPPELRSPGAGRRPHSPPGDCRPCADIIVIPIIILVTTVGTVSGGIIAACRQSFRSKRCAQSHLSWILVFRFLFVHGCNFL